MPGKLNSLITVPTQQVTRKGQRFSSIIYDKDSFHGYASFGRARRANLFSNSSHLFYGLRLMRAGVRDVPDRRLRSGCSSSSCLPVFLAPARSLPEFDGYSDVNLP
jgi:hypothetical protein